MSLETRRTPTGRGRGLPTSSKELAQLISQHVNVALEQHNVNQNIGWGRGRGTSGNTSGGTPIGAHSGRKMTKKNADNVSSCYLK